MRRPSCRIRVAAALVAAASLLAGCTGVELLAEAAFPTAVPGLPVGRPWFSLPLGAWLTDGDVVARAISACSDPACGPPAVVGLFEAAGPAAGQWLHLAEDPDALGAALAARPGARGRATAPRRTSRPDVAPLREGAFSGLQVRLSRPDGSRPATGIALAARRGSRTLLILVVAATPDGAERIARSVAAAAT